MLNWKRFIPLLGIIALLLVVGCAAGPNPVPGLHVVYRGEAGFWLGLWHGFIMPIAFVVSLFNSGVGIYETHNVGNLYNLGFVLGAMIFFGGAGGSGASGGRRKGRTDPDQKFE